MCGNGCLILRGGGSIFPLTLQNIAIIAAHIHMIWLKLKRALDSCLSLVPPLKINLNLRQIRMSERVSIV